MQEETTLWDGRPSHLKDFGYHLVCLALAPLVVPLGMLVWRFLETQCLRYQLTSERLRVTQGVLSRRLDELELYRVKDTSLDQPFFLRLFGLANIVVTTSDASTPRLVLQALPGAQTIRENLRGRVEKMRVAKGVREVDYA